MQSGKKPPKPFHHLKLIHNEHLTKLQQKSASDIELLEDMRGFLKQRNCLERDFMHAVQKLSTSYLNRREIVEVNGTKEALSQDSAISKSQAGRQPWQVWRRYLQHEQSSSNQRLTALDVQQQMVLHLKPLKVQRTGVSKRLLEQLRSLQMDLAVSLQEMLKSHKVYAEEEKQCHEARLKARAAEEKVRRRSTNLFHSMSQLQKTYDKLIARREDCMNRSTTARNEYLFQLAALNAALQHYYNLDLPEIAKALDGEIHARMREMLLLVTQQALDAAKTVTQNMNVVEGDAKMIQREFCWSEFLRTNPSYQDLVQYQFEPMIGDSVTLLHPPNSKDAETLMNVGRKLIKRLLAHQRRMRAYENEVKTLQGGGRVTPVETNASVPANSDVPSLESGETTVNADGSLPVSYNLEYVEHKVEELVHAIRREEIEKVKIEACLKLLSESGVNVQDMLMEANRAAAAYEAEQLHYQQQLNLQAQQESQRSNQSMWAPSSTYGGLATNDSITSASIYEGSDSLQYVSRSEYGLPPGPYDISGTMLDDVCSLRRMPYVPHAHEGLAVMTHKNVDNVIANTSHRSSLPDGLPEKLGPPSKMTQSVDSDSNLSINLADGGAGGAIRSHIPKTQDTSSTHTDESALEGGQSSHLQQLRATAVFEYQAKRTDELDLVVYETVNIIALGDAPGWLQVESLLDGRVGFIPEAFIQLEHPERDAGRLAALKAGLPLNLDLSTPATSGTEVTKGGDGTVQQSAKGGAENEETSSLDSDNYENWNEQYENWGPPPVAPPRSSEGVPVVNKPPSLAVATTASPSSTSPVLLPKPRTRQSNMNNGGTVYVEPSMDLVCSIFPFTATHEDELSFGTGETIHVTSRTTAPGGVDDGWWEGELISVPPQQVSKPRRGLFPSMLVRPAVIPPLSTTPASKEGLSSLIQQTAAFLMSPNVEQRPGPPSFQPPALPVLNKEKLPEKVPIPKTSSNGEIKAVVDNLVTEVLSEAMASEMAGNAPQHQVSRSSEPDEYVQISQNAEYRLADI